MSRAEDELRAGRLTAYVSVVRAEIRNLTHFRANFVAWVLYSPLQIGSVYLLWSIVYRSHQEISGLSFIEMMRYYLVVHVIRRIVEPAQTINYEVWSEINQGRLDAYLARPVDYGLCVFAKSLGVPILESCIGALVLLTLSIALGLPPPSHPGVVVAFAASVCAAYGIMFLIQLTIGTLTFWFERIFGIRDMVFSLFMLLSGQLLPVSLLPDSIQHVSRLFPFEAVYYIPARIYAMEHLTREVIALLTQQAFWIAALWIIARAVWSRGIARYASQGG